MGYNNPVHLYQLLVVRVHQHYNPTTNSINERSNLIKLYYLIFIFTLGRNGNRSKQSFFKTYA